MARTRTEETGSVATGKAENVKDTGRFGTAPRTREEVVGRQRDEFGGFSWGSAFFGCLVAVGTAALLTALLSAAGAAIGLTKLSASEARQSAETIGIVGGILLLIVLAIAYYAG